MGIVSILQESYKQYVYVCKNMYTIHVYMGLFSHIYDIYTIVYVYIHIQAYIRMYICVCVHLCIYM